MLLAVTPSILVSLGIRSVDLSEVGTVLLNDAQFDQSGPVKVLALASERSESQDPHGGLFTADAVADLMQCSRANVYDREKKGYLFSVLPPGRANGRRYPAFQFYAMVDAPFLHKLIRGFRSRNAPMNLLWDFLRSVQPSLGGLSGIELLLGLQPDRRGLDTRTLNELKKLDTDSRQEYVLEHALEGVSYALS